MYDHTHAGLNQLVADVNNDGVMDTIYMGGGDLSSPTGNGWSDTSNYDIPHWPNEIAATDFNGDGWVDLYYEINPYTVYINNRLNGWAESATWKESFTTNLEAINFIDFNSDGLTDIVTQDGKVFFNTTHGWMEQSNWDFVNYSYFNAGTEEYIDLNNDGLLDRVVYNSIKDSIQYVQMRLPNGAYGSQININKHGFLINLNDDPYPDFFDLSNQEDPESKSL